MIPLVPPVTRFTCIPRIARITCGTTMTNPALPARATSLSLLASVLPPTVLLLFSLVLARGAFLLVLLWSHFVII